LTVPESEDQDAEELGEKHSTQGDRPGCSHACTFMYVVLTISYVQNLFPYTSFRSKAETISKTWGVGWREAINPG